MTVSLSLSLSLCVCVVVDVGCRQFLCTLFVYLFAFFVDKCLHAHLHMLSMCACLCVSLCVWVSPFYACMEACYSLCVCVCVATVLYNQWCSGSWGGWGTGVVSGWVMDLEYAWGCAVWYCGSCSFSPPPMPLVKPHKSQHLTCSQIFYSWLSDCMFVLMDKPRLTFHLFFFAHHWRRSQ